MGIGNNPGIPPPDALESQPVSWTKSGLVERMQQEARVRMGLGLRLGLSRGSGKGGDEDENEEMEMELELDELGEGQVEEVLKGLWRVPGGYVVEGECPVSFGLCV